MKKRIFIAVDVSDEVKKAVANYINCLAEKFVGLPVSWEKPEKLHLTLKFLGDTDESLLYELKRRIGEKAKKVENFQLRIKGKGVFPNLQAPRVLWLGVEEDSGKLLKLQNLVEKACCELGFEAEKRGFKPHLTIARIRKLREFSDLVNFHLGSRDFESKSFLIDEVVIYESLLLPTGSVYKVISKHSLG